MSRKILVTGGAGFIGAHTARALAGRGDQVVLFDNFNHHYDPRLKEARVKALAGPPVKVVRGDIRRQADLQSLFAAHRFDAVVHLAAWAGVADSLQRPEVYTAVNVDGTVNVLAAASAARISHLLFASSSSVYGTEASLPFRESADITHPLSPYAATKVAGEVLCATWHHLYGLPITALRFFTVYGPWGRPDMALFAFTDAIYHGRPIAMRGAHTSRDFTYIDDIVQGVLAALDRPRGWRVYNLGRGEAVRLPAVVAAIEQALGKTATVRETPLLAGEVTSTVADITAARRELGYHPTTPVTTGVPQFVQWYQATYVPHFRASLSHSR